MKRTVENGYSVRQVCNLIKITPQAYYKRLRKCNGDNILFTKLENIVKKNRRLKSRAGLRAIHHKEDLSL